MNDFAKRKWEKIVLDAYPNEAVAFASGDVVTRVHNVSKNPRNSFEVSASDYVSEQPSMLLHSHVYQRGILVKRKFDLRAPSFADFVGQQRMRIPWGISSTNGETVSKILWFPKSRNAPLFGRRFCPYVSDCFTIMSDWFWQVRGIEIGERAEIDMDHGVTESPYLDLLSVYGFRLISADEAKIGDLLLMTIDHPFDHASVYLGGSTILQQFENRLSGEWRLGHLRSSVVGAARHKSNE